MQTMHAAEVEWGKVSGHRSGGIDFKRLLQGTPGTPDNFELSIVRTTGDYYTPRHRHNFDQVRYQLSGDFDFSTDGVMKPGSVAYFPEGTYYGPQQCDKGSETLVLQFGGASRSGYLSAEEHERASAELASRGRVGLAVGEDLSGRAAAIRPPTVVRASLAHPTRLSVFAQSARTLAFGLRPIRRYPQDRLKLSPRDIHACATVARPTAVRSRPSPLASYSA